MNSKEEIMYMTLHVVPNRGAYLLSVAGTQARGGAAPSSSFATLAELVTSLESVGISAKTISLMESTLKGGLAFTLPGVDLVDADLPKLGF
jgi:hypothetical protein